MSDVHLNFINQSNDRNNSDIVIFQKNVAVNFEEVTVAWTVIQNCGQGWNHPFVYPSTMTVAASDSYGNFSTQLTASFGQRFSVVENESGDTLILSGQSSSLTEVEVLNALQMGAVNANIYKDGRLLATKTSIAPEQKAVFEFKPTVWIGVVSQVGEGDVMNSAILSNVNTEISLFGIKSADIVMTGGGPGAESIPFMFTLQNVVYA
ncbi:MAG: hypothetical protein P4L41_05325 [Flavipsychrobacter sp.]|nr:hypothetical protein [Flavipsychrobacter sp.]